MLWVGHSIFTLPVGPAAHAGMCTPSLVSSRASFFKVGKSQGRNLIAVVKGGALSTTFKCFELRNGGMSLYKVKVFYRPIVAACYIFADRNSISHKK